MWRAFARLFHVRLLRQEKFALYKSFCSHLRYTKFVFGLRGNFPRKVPPLTPSKAFEREGNPFLD